MNDRAIRIVVDFASSKIEACPLGEQVRLYQALAEIMPTKSERDAARQVAVQLSHAAALQTDFTRQLFKEIQWPGHQHDGAGQKGAK